MSNPVPYFDLIREMKNAFNYRLWLVTHARQHGIKPGSPCFPHHRRHGAQVAAAVRGAGVEGFTGTLPRPPHSSPHKIVGELAQRVVERRRQLPTFGAQRLKREWALPLSHVAIQRLWREHGLLRKRRRKYQRKQDLAALKATWALFQQISAETKDLDDIPHYWPPMKRRGVPPVQYTARRGPQRLAVSRLCLPPLRPGQRLVRPPPAEPSPALRCPPPGRHLANRQRRGVHRGVAERRLAFRLPPRRHLLRLPTRSHPARRPHLPE